jgi:hypothetical protein
MIRAGSGGAQVERPMNIFIVKIRQLRSLLRARICRRLAATLGVLLIAFAALAATTAVKHAPVPPVHSAGGNLMLVPGWPGLAPVLY